jgi:hypothetical protein
VTACLPRADLRRSPFVDIAALTGFLAPFLGSFLSAGREALTEAAERGGEAALQHARGIWERLSGKVAERPEAGEAAQKLAGRPSSSRRQRALGAQIEALLAEDPKLADELGALFAQAREAGVVAIASGDRSAAVAGDVSGSVIITGDDVSVEQ